MAAGRPGDPVVIPYGRQTIERADIDAVVEILKSDFLTQGPAIPRFEQALAAYCEVAHGVAVCNATAALHVACRALDLGPGDILWTTPITFVASANCALYCGAEVDFVDIDARTGNMSVERLAEKLAGAEREGRLPKIVVPVHMTGQSAEMQPIAELAARYGFRIVEDASHAVGASYGNGRVGDCRYSDIAVFSFHPVKIITTGEGGMAMTNDADLAAKMALLRTHGLTRDASLLRTQSPGGWYYEQHELGFNYRMTDIQAALGYSQLQRLEELVQRRRRLAGRYDAAFEGLPLTRPWQHPDTNSSWHLYVIRVDAAIHASAFEQLRKDGIGVNLHYIPVPRQPYYRALGFDPADWPEAERYYAEAITLPLYPGLREDEQDHVIAAVKDALGCA
jgi:UDP-4-amino-4,6-dideoxy-N-acetyl-beta-L-altrosamine transaminase